MGNPKWQNFVNQLEAVNDVRQLPHLIVETLSPPLYAQEALHKVFYICDFCFAQRIDQCAICHKSVCEEHSTEYNFNFLWYLCPSCQKIAKHNLKQIKEMDAELHACELKEEEDERAGSSVE